MFVVDDIVFGADNEGLSDGFDGERLLFLLGIVDICTEATALACLFMEAFDALGCGGNLDC